MEIKYKYEDIKEIIERLSYDNEVEIRVLNFGDSCCFKSEQDNREMILIPWRKNIFNNLAEFEQSLLEIINEKYVKENNKKIKLILIKIMKNQLCYLYDYISIKKDYTHKKLSEKEIYNNDNWYVDIDIVTLLNRRTPHNTEDIIDFVFGKIK